MLVYPAQIRLPCPWQQQVQWRPTNTRYIKVPPEEQGVWCSYPWLLPTVRLGPASPDQRGKDPELPGELRPRNPASSTTQQPPGEKLCGNSARPLKMSEGLHFWLWAPCVRQGKGVNYYFSDYLDYWYMHVLHIMRPLCSPSPTGRGGSKGRKIFCIYVSINSSRETDQTFIYSVFQDTSPRYYI